MRVLAVAVCLGTTLVVSTPAGAQVELTPVAPAVFSDSIDVKLVNIDVFVTDGQGNAVDGLGIDDFEIFEDGELVSISHFARIEPPAGPGSVGGSQGSAAATAASEGLLPHLIIAFDSRHITQIAKRRMMKGLRRYIEESSIPPERVMIMILAHDTHQSFDVAVPFGSTREELEEGLDRVKEMAPGGRTVQHSYENLLDSLAQAHYEYRRRAASNPGGPGGLQATAQACTAVRRQWKADIRAYASETIGRVDGTVQRLVGLMNLLSAVPGHKSFLYVGGGLELVPAEDVYVYANKICPGSFNVMDAQADTRAAVLKSLTDVANANRISFNAFEASSFHLSMTASPEFRSSIYTPGATVDRYRTQNLQNSLFMMANETGGKALLGTNGFFPEPEIIDRALSSYYSLGFSPLGSGSSDSHTIRVELREGKGLELRYRRSYSMRPHAAEQDDKLMSVLALGWNQNPLDIRVDHGDVGPVEGKGDAFLVPLSVSVPVNLLVCVPDDAREVNCRVRLLMRACDEKDRVSPLYERSYEISFPENTSPKRRVTLQLVNKVRGGDHRFVVGVVDELGLAASYLVHPVAVGETIPPE